MTPEEQYAEIGEHLAYLRDQRDRALQARDLPKVEALDEAIKDTLAEHRELLAVYPQLSSDER